MPRAYLCVQNSPPTSKTTTTIGARPSEPTDHRRSLPVGAGGVPELSAALELRQIAGIHAGGTYPLAVGSYRFGHRSSPSALAAGEPTTPRFGLTIDPAGCVTLIPPPGGIRLDGFTVLSPTSVALGQVIDAGSARFVVATAGPPLQQREKRTPGVAPLAPSRRRGRAVDPSVLEWGLATRSVAARERRKAALNPYDIRQIVASGGSGLFAAAPGQTSFGRVVMALTDFPFAFPGDLSDLNPATLHELEAIGSLPSAPIGVDLGSHSIALVGTRSATRPIASWVALSLCAQSRRGSLIIELQTGNRHNDWAWFASLPTMTPTVPRPLHVRIIDESAPHAVPETGAIVLLERGQELPESVGVVLDVRSDTATIVDRFDGFAAEGVTPVGVSSLFALEVAYQLAEFVRRGGDHHDDDRWLGW